MQVIGNRIKEERERLGLTQVEFAAEANAGKRTLADWEKGSTTPTAAQLNALMSIGVDVTYIVTGQRLTAIKSAEEEVLLKAYRSLTPKTQKDILLKVIAAEQKRNKKEENKAISIVGDNNANNILGSNISIERKNEQAKSRRKS